MLKASRPWVRLISPRSVSACRMIAVELMAMAPPTSEAMSQGKPKPRAISANTAMVAPTCSAPSPNTSRRIAIMRGSENSSPRVNSRNTTPSSASRRVAAGVRDDPQRMRPERQAHER